MRTVIFDRPVFTIRAASDLDSLLAARRRGWSRRRVRIQLAFPGLTPRDRSRYERSLSRAASACGCAEAAACGLVSAAGAAFAAFQMTPAWSCWTATIQIGWVAVTFVAGVVTGKLFGLALARRRLSRLVSELLDVPGVVP
jgi:hypothetical protein